MPTIEVLRAVELTQDDWLWVLLSLTRAKKVEIARQIREQLRIRSLPPSKSKGDTDAPR